MTIRVTLLLLVLNGCFNSAPDPVVGEADSGPPPPAAASASRTAAASSESIDKALAEPAAARGTCGNGVREGAELCDGADCPTLCPKAGCVNTELIGARETCDARCVFTEISVCGGADGCCPAGCNHGSDADCSPSCGDGVITGAEKCEPGSLAQPCPTLKDCDDGDPCTEDKLLGSATQCSAQCAHMPITRTVTGDRCCPAGANVGTDADCQAACGDSVVSAGERCDPALRGSCPTSASCAQLNNGCSRGVLVGTACEAHCDLEEIKDARSGDDCCPLGANAGNDNDCSPACGDGVVSAGEECDPSVPEGQYGRCPTTDDDCSLQPSDPCQRGVLVGAPKQCNARCSIGPRPVGERDSCCPSGASSATDPDCAPECGNGIVEDGEACDSGPGSAQPCPTARTCPSEPCNARRIVGSGCTATCEDEVLAMRSGDGCCPPGATASSDSDCHDGVEGYWAECNWTSVYAPGWTQEMPLAPPAASRLYGCDGTASVCMSKECVPVCEAGDTRTPDGWEGYCLTDAHPPIFEIFCGPNDSCPAPRECLQTSQNARKLCR